MKEIYDSVYNNFENYDEKYDYKINLVDLQFKNFSKDANILDIGCGKGHYIRYLTSKG
jgi:ubiquinone/menaquinone biosynthesis C-methylase UbiE